MEPTNQSPSSASNSSVVALRKGSVCLLVGGFRLEKSRALSFGECNFPSSQPVGTSGPKVREIPTCFRESLTSLTGSSFSYSSKTSSKMNAKLPTRLHQQHTGPRRFAPRPPLVFAGRFGRFCAHAWRFSRGFLASTCYIKYGKAEVVKTSQRITTLMLKAMHCTLRTGALSRKSYCF